MTAAQIVHDIQDTYNTSVKSIADGEAAKAALLSARDLYKSDIAELTDETQLAFIEQLLAECEAAAK